MKSTNIRILFLDDSSQRYNTFKNNNNQYTIDWAKNVNEAIVLAASQKYDYMFLDHDLGEKLDGMDFAKWLGTSSFSSMIKENNTKFICHSMNGIGRQNMISYLNSAGYTDITGIPIAWDKHFIFE